MKITYLVRKTQPNGSVALEIASKAEWDTILKANKGLPTQERRLFIKDTINDAGEKDCMFIEVSYEEYRAWNKEQTMACRNLKERRKHHQLSLDAPSIDSDIEDLHEYEASEERFEEIILDGVLMTQLRAALTAWKPWGPELLDYYLAGNKRGCTKQIADKYGVSLQTAREYKRCFEKFAIKFLLEVSF